MNFIGSFNPLAPIVRFATSQAAAIYLSSITGMQVGDTVEIMLNDGTLFRTTITQVLTSLSAIHIAQGLPYFASAGNVVIDLTQAKIVPPTTASDIV